jgi:hypothetical protein
MANVIEHCKTEEDKDNNQSFLKKDSKFRKDFRAMRKKMQISLKETFSSTSKKEQEIISPTDLSKAELLNSIYDFYPSFDLLLSS